MLQPMSASRPARWRVDGKTALVIGASKGIGRATVEALAELGARVMGIARGLNCSRKFDKTGFARDSTLR
jgi:NAD(P)-dependent dehydrogenase (short-subunit alcohol dehydrogenase family)